MFGKSVKLFKLFGFEVKIDISWLVIAVLVAWMLAKGLFPFQVAGLSQSTYWWMGVAGALGLFVSIVFHELWHSLIARRYKLQMKGITLFIFGGVSEMTEEPENAKVEFWMAIAGPLSSLALAAIFYGLSLMLTNGTVLPQFSPFSVLPEFASGTSPVTVVLYWMGFFNVALAIFNIVPAFPLDGGRVLRAAIWAFDKDIVKATKIAAFIGSAFAVILIVFGLYGVLRGQLAYLWNVLIGWFLWTAARTSYQQVLVRKGLEGMTVQRFMQANPVTVSRSLSVERFVEDYIYKHTFKMYPVVDGERLFGCASLQKVRDLPRDEWPRKTVGEIAGDCSSENTIEPSASATQALSKMSRSGHSRLIVVEGQRLVGIITVKDMLQFLNSKLQLGELGR
ncbi:MAG: site-2 protease family protein [Chloroflexi bacterium]|nr:site-2 protease family protein [Chloroflexota bacterium]